MNHGMNCKKRPQNDVVNEKYPPRRSISINFVEFFKLQEKLSFKMVTEIWSKLKDKDIV